MSGVLVWPEPFEHSMPSVGYMRESVFRLHSSEVVV